MKEDGEWFGCNFACFHWTEDFQIQKGLDDEGNSGLNQEFKFNQSKCTAHPEAPCTIQAQGQTVAERKRRWGGE